MGSCLSRPAAEGDDKESKASPLDRPHSDSSTAVSVEGPALLSQSSALQWCDAQGTPASVLALIEGCGENHPPRRQAILAIACTGAISLLPADGNTAAGIAKAADSTSTTLLEVRSVNAIAQTQLGVDGPEAYARLLHLSDPKGLNQLGLLLKVAALSATVTTSTGVSGGGVGGEVAPRTLLPMQQLPHAAPSGGDGGGLLSGSCLEIMEGGRGGKPCGHAAAAPGQPLLLLLLRHVVPAAPGQAGAAAASELRPMTVSPAAPPVAPAPVAVSAVVNAEPTMLPKLPKLLPAGSFGGTEGLLDHVPDILSLCLIGGNVIYQV